jgi:hypothetical protein
MVDNTINENVDLTVNIFLKRKPQKEVFKNEQVDRNDDTLTPSVL